MISNYTEKSAMIDVVNVRKSLDSLAYKVEHHDAEAANRLRSLSEAIGGGPLVDLWAASDIYTLIAPDTIVERFISRRRFSTFISILEWLRNGLILAFIIVTWSGISQATQKYNDFLRIHPDQISQPFLFLWQQGFGGMLPSVFTFSSIITIDASIIALILLLTLWLRIENNRKERDAINLRAVLVDTLARASLSFGNRQMRSPSAVANIGSESPQWAVTMFQAINHFEVAANRQLQLQEDEMSSLDKLIKRIDQMPDFTLTVSDTSNMMYDAARLLQKATVDLTTSINDLVNPTREILEQQRSTFQAATESVNLLEKVAEAQELFIQKQDKFSENLRDTMDTQEIVLEKFGILVGDASNVFKQQSMFLQKLEVERTAQTDLANVVSSTAVTLREALTDMKTGASALQSMVMDMQDLVKIQASIPDAMGDAIQSYSRTAEAIARSCNSLDASAIAIYQASQELKNVVSELEKRLK